MALPSIKNSVGMAVTAVADSGEGTITLGAALSGGYQTAGTAYAADANIDIRIEEGDTWEVCRDCTYDHSELTVTRGTLEDGSSGTSTRVAFTSAAKVYVVEPAARILAANATAHGHLSGLIWSYSAAPDQIAIAAGDCLIDGVLLTRASSGDITATVSATGIWYIYGYNSSGSLAFESSQTDPVFDATRNYHTKTGDTSRRWIGWYLVYSDTTGSATNKVAPFITHGRDREIELVYKINRTTGHFVIATLNLVTTGTSTTFAAVGLASLVPACATQWRAFAGAYGGASGDDVTIGLRDWAHVTGDVASDCPYSVRAQPAATYYIFFGMSLLPISNVTPEYYYAISRPGTSGSALIRCMGAVIRR